MNGENRNDVSRDSPGSFFRTFPRRSEKTDPKANALTIFRCSRVRIEKNRPFSLNESLLILELDEEMTRIPTE
jgi:hypothetical protein